MQKQWAGLIPGDVTQKVNSAMRCLEQDTLSLATCDGSDKQRFIRLEAAFTSFDGKSCLAAQGDPTSKTPAPVTLVECSSSGAPAEEFALEPAPNANASTAQFRLEVGDGRCIAAQPTQPAA